MQLEIVFLKANIIIVVRFIIFYLFTRLQQWYTLLLPLQFIFKFPGFIEIIEGVNVQFAFFYDGIAYLQVVYHVFIRFYAVAPHSIFVRSD